ncbi:SDR family oxidoreductase [Klugiella xanthotipulae]|uniref:NAD(P)-dependent dehydrogenase (Short-subunit alcohol dehydrogenase family) n=1 Tax=Klugiella xanthotipulae TaxID=244735 RepID=A0A543HT59_9MICO|nr:SDR family oxidoreductase [Klugiella xanthotipulae]TQM61546.1 NAD(P)-dependent dehydrogenase (short-subunit alcohol dehydrogenase family) [Klugiella xanthotipulae]
MRPLTIVTGGSRGIGAAVCERLARDGHDLVVAYRRERAAALGVLERVRVAGGNGVVAQVDTADERSVERLYAAAAAYGSVTGLVNNAGMSGPNGLLVDADVAGMRRALDVNVLGYLVCAQRAAQLWTASAAEGAIVNISSAAATLGGAGQYVHYAAAKAAVDALTVGLARELAGDGIRVNAVAPGTVWTEFHEDPDRPRRVAADIPMGRAGQPHEIAGAVSWLLSADSSYATGSIIRVAGGL